MADKWVVYITHGVYVDMDRVLDPESSEEDYNELRTRAVLKMWTQGYDTVKTESEIEFENVTKEFTDERKTT
jgi:hypothetical protein